VTLIALFIDRQTRHTATVLAIALFDIVCFAAVAALIVSVLP